MFAWGISGFQLGFPRIMDNVATAPKARQKIFHWALRVAEKRLPYRVEGKKTMGYEVAEQLGWRLPDVIVYPTGGGTGLVGMWKAFDEMERLVRECPQQYLWSYARYKQPRDEG